MGRPSDYDPAQNESAAMSDESENTPPKRIIGRPFQPGNPGRPKGSKNKLADAFVADLHDDWLEHGPAVIAQVRAEKPDQYMKVIASIIPKDHNVTVNNVDDLSDAELAERVRSLAQTLAPFLAEGTGAVGEGYTDSASPQQPSRVH